MTIVVAKEVENFIMRANNSNDAVFYALNFLSMLNFEALKHETLMYLSKLFFNVFFKFTEVKEQENEKIHRIQSILLKSLNKIFPLIKELVTTTSTPKIYYYFRTKLLIKLSKSTSTNFSRWVINAPFVSESKSLSFFTSSWNPVNLYQTDSTESSTNW